MEIEIDARVEADRCAGADRPDRGGERVGVDVVLFRESFRCREPSLERDHEASEPNALGVLPLLVG
ncbi:hypothetical protein LRS73_08410 [Methylobacterium currus]|uniref:hypothetical protein n=1 Tax=Methylobacterium currus TaxID=2051553 RepID=UPI001E407AD5|nr:hypothetical protein [Methylobacterium currus]UHC17864.1 hypothetical protein LRS73_08410 [Methylobacterium currus]